MVELRLVGLSEDHSQLILTDAAGREFAVPVDERLRAALRGDRARLGQLEIQMESALRPRDIQARIRAGDSPEDVAQVAQVPVERIMGYAVPVLAEREHVAERAQRCPVRRQGAEGPGQLLGDAVSERLRSRNVNPEAAEWNAWRRDDGRWNVEVGYVSGERRRAARFVYDALGRYAVADDDDARWLVGEPTTKRGPQPREKSSRRLSAVSEEEEALSLDHAAQVTDLTAVAEAVRSGQAAASVAPGPVRADPQPPDPPAEPSEPARPDRRKSASRKAESGAKPKKRGRRGRASIPSWDEIMFGDENKD
ncbi:MAG: DUF3071 domain-containing protein [Propionibacteriales bacterium]|nr:DUF3071 domain-containing protein [Propionibacteriales bacterium]